MHIYLDGQWTWIIDLFTKCCYWAISGWLFSNFSIQFQYKICFYREFQYNVTNCTLCEFVFVLVSFLSFSFFLFLLPFPCSARNSALFISVPLRAVIYPSHYLSTFGNICSSVVWIAIWTTVVNMIYIYDFENGVLRCDGWDVGVDLLIEFEWIWWIKMVHQLALDGLCFVHHFSLPLLMLVIYSINSKMHHRMKHICVLYIILYIDYIR